MYQKSILLPICLFFTSVLAMDPLPPKDPLARLDYRSAFNQEKIHREYPLLMTEMGCSENVFGSFVEHHQDSSGLDHEVHLQSFNEYLYEDRVFDRYLPPFQKACLARLNRERAKTLLEPAREAVTLMALMTVATGALLQTTGADSFGGGFGIFAALFNCIWFVRDIIRSGYNLYDTPPHPLDSFEKQFALNQCFIPKALWASIIDKFVLARSNPFEQGRALEFIEFTLGLTIHAPKPFFPHNQKLNEDDVLDRIDQYFDSYEAFEDKRQLHTLKMNVRQFLCQLRGQKTSCRYIYLTGSGGIGKTYFAQQLTAWIKEFFPHSTSYEALNIGSPEELEGTIDRPGAFLRVLRNQCLANTIGSVVFMDEANWLEDEDFNASAKRVFNDNPKELSATYFGAGVDGTGIKLRMPLMLALLASNNDIKDQALKSRFDCINFPTPKFNSLIDHACRLIKSNPLSYKIDGLLQGKNIEKNFQDTIENAVKEFKNFREVESVIPALLSEWYDNQRVKKIS